MIGFKWPLVEIKFGLDTIINIMPINRSINQPINQAIIQSINQSIILKVKQNKNEYTVNKLAWASH